MFWFLSSGSGFWIGAAEHGIFAAASRLLCGSYDKHSASTDGSVLCLWLGQPQAEGRFVLWYLFISLASDQSDLFQELPTKVSHIPLFVCYLVSFLTLGVMSWYVVERRIVGARK